MHLINHCRRPHGRALWTPKLEASPKPHPPASRSINTLSTGEIDYDALALERTVKCYSSKPTQNTSTVSRVSRTIPHWAYTVRNSEEPLSALCDEYDPPSCFSTDLFCGVDVPAGNIELGGRHDGWMQRSKENAKINIGALGCVRRIVSEDESGEVNLEIV